MPPWRKRKLEAETEKSLPIGFNDLLTFFHASRLFALLKILD
jgi:hypothetical protein